MNTQQTKPIKRCRSGTAIGVRYVTVGFAIIGKSVAVCAAVGAVIGAAMNDMSSGFAWGVAGGAALGSYMTMALSFRERH